MGGLPKDNAADTTWRLAWVAGTTISNVRSFAYALRMTWRWLVKDGMDGMQGKSTSKRTSYSPKPLIPTWTDMVCCCFVLDTMEDGSLG